MTHLPQRSLHLLFLIGLVTSRYLPQSNLSWIFIPVTLIWVVSIVAEAGFWTPTNDSLRKIISGLIPLSVSSFILVSFPFNLNPFLLGGAAIFAAVRIIRPAKKNGISIIMSLLREIPLLPGILLLFLGASALIPRMYHDGLNYHLLGPWLWAESGGLAQLEKYIPVFHCNYFEQLFFWVMMIVPKTMEGQIQAHILSQLLHFFFGGILTSVIAIRLFRKHGEMGNFFFLAGLSYLIFRLSLGQLLVVAKNDWVLISIGLFLLYSIFEETLDPWLIGAAAGYLFTLKFSYAPYVFFCLALGYSRDLRVMGKISVAAATISVPFLLRNYFFTHNPVFPLFPDFFQSPILGPTWISSFAELSVINITPWQWLEKFHVRLIAENPLNYGLYFLPFYYVVKKDWKFLKYSVIGFGSLCFLFIISSITITETRHSGVSIILLQLCFYLTLIKLASSFGKKTVQTVIQGIVFLSALLPYTYADDQHLILEKRWSEFFNRSPETYVLTRPGNELLSLVRKLAPSRTAVVSDQPLYYFVSYNFVKVSDWAILDKHLSSAADIPEALKDLKTLGFTYVFINEYFFDRMANRTFAMKFFNWLQTHQQAIVLTRKDSRLIDLTRVD